MMHEDTPMGSQKEPIISITDLSFRYENTSKPVFEHLSLTVNRGAYISVVGENGAGKSTLVKLILGLLKPTYGTVDCLSKKIGYVPQKKAAVAGFPVTVFEMLNAYRILINCGDKTIIDQQLEAVHLSEYKHALAGTLSGGQLQKLYIARALMGSPDLLILDEPSTGVDVNSQKEVYAFIKNLNTEKNLTVISVEHNLDAAVFNSTDIFHIAKGRGHLCNPQKYAAEFIPLKNQSAIPYSYIGG